LEIEPPEAESDPTKETGRRCVNPECPAQVEEKIIWFAGRKQMDIEGLGEKTVRQIRAESKIPLSRFADIFRLAEHRDELLALGLPEDPKDRISTELGKETAPIFHAYLHSPQARKTFQELREVGVDLRSREYAPPSKRAKVAEGPFAGKTVVITGTLENYERE